MTSNVRYMRAWTKVQTPEEPKPEEPREKVKKPRKPRVAKVKPPVPPPFDGKRFQGKLDVGYFLPEHLKPLWPYPIGGDPFAPYRPRNKAHFAKFIERWIEMVLLYHPVVICLQELWERQKYGED